MSTLNGAKTSPRSLIRAAASIQEEADGKGKTAVPTAGDPIAFLKVKSATIRVFTIQIDFHFRAPTRTPTRARRSPERGSQFRLLDTTSLYSCRAFTFCTWKRVSGEKRRSLTLYKRLSSRPLLVVHESSLWKECFRKTLIVAYNFTCYRSENRRKTDTRGGFVRKKMRLTSLRIEFRKTLVLLDFRLKNTKRRHDTRAWRTIKNVSVFRNFERQNMAFFCLSAQKYSARHRYSTIFRRLLFESNLRNLSDK